LATGRGAALAEAPPGAEAMSGIALLRVPSYLRAVLRLARSSLLVAERSPRGAGGQYLRLAVYAAREESHG
jgi:hypothetical protein